jgi:hypothetical protein
MTGTRDGWEIWSAAEAELGSAKMARTMAEAEASRIGSTYA